MASSFIRIALAGAGCFAEVSFVEGDTISRMAKRACIKFSHWGVNAGQISLYLVAAGGDDEPTEEAIGAVLSSGGRLGVGWSLTRAGITSGAWLVARKIVDGGASCSSLALVFPFAPLTYSHTSPSLQGRGRRSSGARARRSSCGCCGVRLRCSPKCSLRSAWRPCPPRPRSWPTCR